MNCSRCKVKLIEGYNTFENWHLPICFNCRKLLIAKQKFKLNKKEGEIFIKRLEKDDGF